MAHEQLISDLKESILVLNKYECVYMGVEHISADQAENNYNRKTNILLICTQFNNAFGVSLYIHVLLHPPLYSQEYGIISKEIYFSFFFSLDVFMYKRILFLDKHF